MKSKEEKKKKTINKVVPDAEGDSEVVIEVVLEIWAIPLAQLTEA